MEKPDLYIEALIFASENSIRLEEIVYCLQLSFEQDFSENEVKGAIQNIRQKYQQPDFAIELVNINNGYQFLTKKDYHIIIKQLQLQRSKKKLSQAALETLAIIAYQQPVTKLDIEQIRGVNCDYSIQKLLEKELITIAGKAESIGRPIIYATSEFFMDYFGINHINELPQLKELAPDNSSVGDQSE
ncbi:SMC-Scp complex subunit ScpB [Mucilaginibacter paludis]|uniref:Chromosome segregation and condensation protein, ScpB n=1 Tax=Mucilaginibacter paludis DSM 18603 TaxID=714943 RepID=H1Y5F7_9SPHI|nr:SMC-Scp complex subunit ScpB [Mucilaginibacter paludis]EHQ29309.1 chromosome segregation and condensation protein, ScpB [Mucilaginibacter paludis DSM 18603]